MNNHELSDEEVTKLFRWCTKGQRVPGQTPEDLVQYLWEQLLQSGPQKRYAPFLRNFVRCRLVDLRKATFRRPDVYEKYTSELPEAEYVAVHEDTTDIRFEVSQFRRPGLSKHARALLDELEKTGTLRPRTDKEYFSLREGRREIQRRFFPELCKSTS